VKRSPLANTIALHDFAITTHDLRGWVAYTVGLFKECGLEPTRMGITAPSIKSTKMHTYKREIKKLEGVLKREINYNIFTTDEFKKKAKEKDSFIIDLLENPKIFIVGREDDL
jgi:hypothetical protein